MVSKIKEKIKAALPRMTIRRKWKLLKAVLWISLAGVLILAAVLIWGIGSRPLPRTVEYAWALGFAIVFLMALVLPLFVRKMEVRLHPMPNLFQKQLILYTSVALFPVVLLCLVFGGAAFAGQVKGIPWLPSFWLLAAFLFSTVLLSAWAIFLAVHDMNQRIVDSLLVITNGMEMASNLDFDRPIVAPSLDEIGLVSEIFNHVSRLLKTRVNILQALFNNMRIFSGLLNEEKILKHTLKSFKSLEDTSEIVVALWDEDGEELVVKGGTQDKPGIVGMRFRKGEGVLGKIIEEPQLLACPEEDYEIIASRSQKEADLWGRPGFVVGVPMLFQGRLKGAVVLYNMKFNDYQMDVKRDYLQGLANQIAIFLENARLYGMVIRDRLTGLYVHSFIEAEMENLIAQARRYKFPISFIMFDVDKFKQINDQYGHPAGNKVLKAMAGIIRSVSRDSDLLGRFGGDEFEIVLPHTDKEGALIYTDKLRKAVELLEVEVAPDVKAHVTVSIGLATYPKDSDTVNQLQAAADSALYGAKALGRNCVVLYETTPK